MVDKTLTVPAVGQMGYPVPVAIGDITAQAVADAEAALAAGVAAIDVATLGVGANGLAMSGSMRAGAHAVTSGEASAHTLAVATGVTTAVAFVAQILRGGAVITGDAAVSFAGGSLTVANGAILYVLTAGDVVEWIVVGA